MVRSAGIEPVRILLFEFIVALCVVGQELIELVIMCIGRSVGVWVVWC